MNDGSWWSTELATCWLQGHFYFKVSDPVPLSTEQFKCGLMGHGAATSLTSDLLLLSHHPQSA